MVDKPAYPEQFANTLKLPLRFFMTWNLAFAPEENFLKQYWRLIFKTIIMIPYFLAITIYIVDMISRDRGVFHNPIIIPVWWCTLQGRLRSLKNTYRKTISFSKTCYNTSLIINFKFICWPVSAKYHKFYRCLSRRRFCKKRSYIIAYLRRYVY
jgi:hypothetical protein